MNVLFVVVSGNIAALLLCSLITNYHRAHTRDRGSLVSDQLLAVTLRLQELYGPLVSLLTECYHLSPTFQPQGAVRREAGTEGGRVLTPDAQTASSFFSSMQNVVDLVGAKTHLFHEERPPQSFYQFLRYQQAWLVQPGGQDISGLHFRDKQADLVWPQAFSRESMEAYLHLRQLHIHLLLGKRSKLDEQWACQYI